jgi:hypothetical protein
MYIKLYRLADGTQIVGKEESHYIKDALQVTLTQEENNGEKALMIGLVPLLYPFQTAHKGTDIDRSHILCSIDCPNEILNVYMQATSALVSGPVPTLTPATKG